MAPPKSARYLQPVLDYENFEFRSPVNPWDPQPQYHVDFDKIKCLELTLSRGQTLFIPAFWWYSIRFTADCSVSCLRYRTYMNNVAISPHIAMYALQLHNVKRKTLPTVAINTPSSKKDKLRVEEDQDQDEDEDQDEDQDLEAKDPLGTEDLGQRQAPSKTI
jgi:hypothetical protein